MLKLCIATGTTLWVVGLVMRKDVEEYSQRSHHEEMWNTLLEHWIIGTPLYTIVLSLAAAGMLPIR
jgi:Zn-dependent M16 (insulinase) family peptidase